MSNKKNNQSETAILSEFSAIRNEITTRIGIRHQMLAISITLLGLLMAFGAKDKEIGTFLFLLYPILCTFFAMGWTHNDFRLFELGTYIRKIIESKLPDMGWEQYIFNRSSSSKRIFRGQEMSALGIFVGSEILSISIALLLEFIPLQSGTPTKRILPFNQIQIIKLIILIICLFSICYTYCLIKKRRKYTKIDYPKALKIEYNEIINDIALKASDSRGDRKVLVTKLREDTEKVVKEKINWHAPVRAEKCPVQIMRDTELAHFNQNAMQERHYHKIATEIYMVLEGTMVIEIEDKDYTISEKDVIIVNPGTVHQVKSNGNDFICRLIAINSIGASDKHLKHI